MCSVRRVKGGRISKVGPRRAPVDAATLVPVRAMAGERIRVDAGASASASGCKRSERVDMPREALEAGNEFSHFGVAFSSIVRWSAPCCLVASSSSGPGALYRVRNRWSGFTISGVRLGIICMVLRCCSYAR